MLTLDANKLVIRPSTLKSTMYKPDFVRKETVPTVKMCHHECPNKLST